MSHSVTLRQTLAGIVLDELIAEGHTARVLPVDVDGKQQVICDSFPARPWIDWPTQATDTLAHFKTGPEALKPFYYRIAAMVETLRVVRTKYSYAAVGCWNAGQGIVVSPVALPGDDFGGVVLLSLTDTTTVTAERVKAVDVHAPLLRWFAKPVAI